MNRKLFVILFLILSLVSITLAQNNRDNIFVPLRQIGILRPSGIQYDPNFDRFAMVDLQGQLVLADAATFQTQHILYKSGAYNAYVFSHDGRYLALAIDVRMELWDTQSGSLTASFEPDGALLVQGPLHFTPDDSLLLLDTVVPAPQATRTSENDTDIIPWLWDLVSARKEGRSTLPGQAKAHPFFSFRNGLVIGPNRYLITGVPGRLQVIDGGNNEFPVIGEIDSSRLERDPIYVWSSATDDYLYIDPKLENKIVQVDTRKGTIFDVPLENDLNYSNIESMTGLALSTFARIIGQPNSQRGNSLLSLLLGGEYGGYQDTERRTVMLLDILKPLTMGDDQMGLLIYNFNNESGRGVLELIHPQDVLQMVLSPDHAHLMVRRASGLQPIEVYNLDSGVLEKSYYPSEPDSSGTHTLAYNTSGTAIISDFQRFDVHSGELLQDDPNYTSGFERYFFTEDSQNLITTRGDQWQTWNIESGKIVQNATVNLRGDVVEQSPDASRFLTRFSSNDGEVMEIADVRADTRQSMTIPYLAGRSIETIIPSDDWQNYLVVYAASPQTEHYPGNEIAVYNFTRGKLLFIAGDDLPQPDGRQYGWLDNQTIFVSSNNPDVHSQPERIYGLDYAPSGLPNCLIQAFPEQWQVWQPIWENLTLSLRSDELGHLTERLCAALPVSAAGVVPALTPTAPFVYHADATSIPINIPGVPVCLTSRFQREAIDYAALWRSMTEGLKDDQIANLADMLCEGLIGSVNNIAATPTTNPNMINPPTPTPVANAPSTTDQNSRQQLEVMAINIETGQRSVGSYVPPHGTTNRDISIVTNLFQSMEHFYPSNPALSPDGKLLATTDQNGFIVIYRLTRTYDELMADEANAAATRQAQEPHSIGLLPTLTPTFEYAGGIHPTLTPTVTPTPPPRIEETAPQGKDSQTQEFCPSPTLYDIAAPPADYAASGRLFVAPGDNQVYMTWVLEAATGRFYPQDTLPRCGISEQCNFSFDQQWVIRQTNSIIVSHPDGSGATVLFRPEESSLWPSNIFWVNQHTLRYSYQGYLPDQFEHPITLLRQFDPVSGVRSDPFQSPANVSVNGLPTFVQSTQPGGDESLLLVSTPYSQQGAKYYIYDRSTGKADYFARVDSGVLDFTWHPLGRYLYYRYPDQPDRWYVFDAQTRQHGIFGDSLPFQQGTWSRDGRYSISWFNLPQDEAQTRLLAGQRLPKINMWDSQTGTSRRYCIPETGQNTYDGTPFVWSPDNRYVAFTISLPDEGDVFPTPTTTPDALRPTSTPIPLETQYQDRLPHTMMLDTQTGTITVLSKQASNIILWTDNGGAP
jgi:hypothetical protein